MDKNILIQDNKISILLKIKRAESKLNLCSRIFFRVVFRHGMCFMIYMMSKNGIPLIFYMTSYAYMHMQY